MDFSSRSHFWVNFWNLSLLMFYLLLPYELQVYSSKVLNVSSSSATWFPNIDSVARNFGFTQAFSKKYFSLAEKWGCIITSSEWVETYHFWTLLIINSLIAHNHSSRFTVTIVIITRSVESWTIAITITSVLPKGDSITTNWSLAETFKACLACT